MLMQNIGLMPKITAYQLFWLFFALYLLSHFLPAYRLAPALERFAQDYSAWRGDEEELGRHLLYGYQCAAFSFYTMMRNPITFIGSFANIAVLAMLVLQLLRSPGQYKFIKSLFVVVCIVSTLIWAVALRVGLQSGYYLWTFSSIGMTFALTAQKPFRSMEENDILDEHIVVSEAEKKLPNL